MELSRQEVREAEIRVVDASLTVPETHNYIFIFPNFENNSPHFFDQSSEGERGEERGVDSIVQLALQ